MTPPISTHCSHPSSTGPRSAPEPRPADAPRCECPGRALPGHRRFFRSLVLPECVPPMTDPAAPVRNFGPFVSRHLGPRDADVTAMLAVLGYPSLDALIDAVVPEPIRMRRPLALPLARTEEESLASLRDMAEKNQVFRSYLGLGYHDCHVPPVVQRNVLENPGWYTAYTPYQPEIAQGRLEALLNFQTVVADLTGLEIANASLLDEGTAAAEAMAMTLGAAPHHDDPVYLVDEWCHPQ